MSQKLLFMQTPDFKKMLSDIDKLSSTGIDEAVRSALIECHQYVTPLMKQAISRHRLTGITEASLDETPVVNVSGFEYSIDVGFHVSKGGLPSIFLIRGTPKINPDQQLYDAVYGRTTKNKLYEIQLKHVKDVLQKYMGK